MTAYNKTSPYANSTMSLENASATDDIQQDNSSPAQPRYRHLQQKPLPFPPQNSGSVAHHDAIHGLPAQYDDLQTDSQHRRAKQTTSPGARPIQNRAAFGKWKSKTVPGFPAASVPLPPGITATQIAELYPNHVSDHVILELMRQGKGAKAIDALIPAPPGKTKAGQSHSKIQLRISTIREAFPNENFPITSTKRNRARGKVHKDEPMSPLEKHADHLGYVTAGISEENSLHRVATQLQDDVGFSKGTLNDASPNFISPEDLSRQGQLPPRLEASGLGSPYISELGHPSWSPRHTSPLDVQIKEEYRKHQQLLFILLYANKSLPPLELAQTVRSHCAATYDAISHQLQERSGVTLTKAILPGGWSEHSLSYLQRSIMECYKGHPAFRTHPDSDTIEDHTDNHTQTAVLQELHGRLRDWTRFLEMRLDNSRQTQSHSNLNANADRSVNPGPILPSLHSSSPQTRAGYSSPGAEPDRSSVTFRTTNWGPVRSGTRNHGIVSDDRVGFLSPTSQPQSDSPGKIQTYSEQADHEPGYFERVAQLMKSDPDFELEPAMTDTSELTPYDSRHEFEEYMEEVEEFVNGQARAVDMSPASGKHADFLLKPISILYFAPQLIPPKAN
jgi:hypothetical protein